MLEDALGKRMAVLSRTRRDHHGAAIAVAKHIRTCARRCKRGKERFSKPSNVNKCEVKFASTLCFFYGMASATGIVFTGIIGFFETAPRDTTTLRDVLLWTIA